MRWFVAMEAEQQQAVGQYTVGTSRFLRITCEATEQEDKITKDKHNYLLLSRDISRR